MSDLWPRLATIRALLTAHAGMTAAQNNEAFHWKADCEYLVQLVEVLTGDRDELIDVLRNWVGHCPDCQGYGATMLPDETEIPCTFCAPAQRLIERLRPLPPAPTALAAAEEVLDDLPF